ncbi:MAG: VWA domain-containing protein [Oscillospiraceae bacterium]|nr:VWA domain-containing protein [Oscillospiraceae bacterium]
MKKGLTELVFILDKSGSMGGLETDTIGGYNSMLEKQKAVEGECHITTVLFDNNFDLLHDRIDIKAVSSITEKEYAVGGSTALLDAIGRTIHKIGNAQKHTANDYRAEKVMFIIITDGEENSSREYSAEKVKAQIERQKKNYGWEFIFLGANIDAVETAGRFGISADRAQNYHADSEGVELNFRVMSEAVATFRECAAMPEGWNDEIQKDYKKRGENWKELNKKD